MRAAIAILASSEIQNTIRKIAFDFDRRYNLPFLGSILPAHISLKQGFTFESMPALEDYFDRLAASIQPFEILLDRFYHTAWSGYGILGLNVVETPLLRSLHDRLNRELSQVVQNSSAPFDGEAYRFHLTIELGPLGEYDAYLAYYEALADKQVNLSFIARELALFYYADRPSVPGAFMVYKVLPLGG